MLASGAYRPFRGLGSIVFASRIPPRPLEAWRLGVWFPGIVRVSVCEIVVQSLYGRCTITSKAKQGAWSRKHGNVSLRPYSGVARAQCFALQFKSHTPSQGRRSSPSSTRGDPQGASQPGEKLFERFGRVLGCQKSHQNLSTTRMGNAFSGRAPGGLRRAKITHPAVRFLVRLNVKK